MKPHYLLPSVLLGCAVSFKIGHISPLLSPSYKKGGSFTSPNLLLSLSFISPKRTVLVQLKLDNV